jgi:hypothetical protein
VVWCHDTVDDASERALHVLECVGSIAQEKIYTHELDADAKQCPEIVWHLVAEDHIVRHRLWREIDVYLRRCATLSIVLEIVHLVLAVQREHVVRGERLGILDRLSRDTSSVFLCQRLPFFDHAEHPVPSPLTLLAASALVSAERRAKTRCIYVKLM